MTRVYSEHQYQLRYGEGRLAVFVDPDPGRFSFDDEDARYLQTMVLTIFIISVWMLNLFYLRIKNMKR